MTPADLADLGFSPEQIARFEELRECYPLIEFLESAHEMHRLAFLKWCYRTRRVAAG